MDSIAGGRSAPPYLETRCLGHVGIVGIASTESLQIMSKGVSPSDSYWIRPEGSDLSWSDVNFYDNDFSEDVGNALFDQARPTS